MRNTLTLLSSLALAAAASAQISATSTTTVTGRLLPNSNVELLSFTSQAYQITSGGYDPNVSDDLNHTLDLGGSRSTSHSDDGATTFTASATINRTLDWADFDAIPDVFPQRGYNYGLQGYRYYLTLINRTGVDQTVSFQIDVSRTTSGSAYSPVGQALFDGNGDPTKAGAYAESEGFAGVVDKSDADDLYYGSNVSYYDEFTSLWGSGVASPTYGSSGSFGSYTATYTLPAFQAHVYQIYAASNAYAALTPVPEPAPVVALGLGALGLLRRRRK